MNNVECWKDTQNEMAYSEKSKGLPDLDEIKLVRIK